MSTYELSNFRVWVMPGQLSGSAVYFPWALSSFVHEPRMIPERVSARASGMGSASFRYLRASREEGYGTFYDPGYAGVGCYVAVTAGVTAFTRTAVIFWGYISRKDIVEISGATDKTGSITAQGLGFLLDGTQLSGFRQGAAAGVSTAIGSPPTFNLQGDGGVVVGNKVADSGSVPVFASLPSACSATNLFSRLNVLQHILAYCKPAGMPTLGATGSSAVSTYLNDTATKEIFDLDNVTLKGAIDLLVSRSNGFGWDLIPNASNGWDISVYPLVDTATYASGYPTATPVDIDVSSAAAESVTYVEDAADLWDSVTVQGDNILIGATVSFADGNLVAGWTTSQETSYRAGAIFASDYASLTPDQKVARNEQLRNAPGVGDAFQLYTLAMTTASITRSSLPGTGGSAGPLVPNIAWDGTTASVNDAVYATPYLPSARFSRSVPWLKGVSGNSTDLRNATLKARPEYLGPLVFKYDTSAAAGDSVCQDLSSPWGKRPSPSITPDERSPGLRIVYNPQEIMALGNWTDGTDGACRIDTVSSDPYLRPFNYSKLACTVGIQSDQRVSVTKLRSGVPAASARRSLVVTDDTLQCWVTLSGTIVASATTGAADRVLAHTFVRNDFPTAERLAAMYAAFAFRKRTSVTITLAQPDVLPSWAVIGTMIGNVTEASATGPYPAIVAEAYTVVESIDYSLTYEHPRVTISTTLPSSPSAMSGGGSNTPAGGGPVSQSLGGTVAQAVSGAQQKVASVASRTAKVPTSVGREGASVATAALTVRARFYFTAAAGDLCEAEDTTSGEVFWVDGIHAMTVHRPGHFGATAIYSAEIVGTVTRTSVRRRLVRLIAASTTIAHNVAQLNVVSAAGSGSSIPGVGYAKVQNSAGTTLTTTIGGVSGENRIPMLTENWFVAGWVFDWCHGRYAAGASIPDVGTAAGGVRSILSRGARRNNELAATFPNPGVSCSVSIDPTEPFSVELYAASEDAPVGSPWRGGDLLASVGFSRDAAGGWRTDCISRFFTVIVSDTVGASDYVTRAYLERTSTTSVSTWLQLFDAGGGTGNQTFTLSASINAATGRIEAVILTSGASFNAFTNGFIAMIVTGGRPRS